MELPPFLFLTTMFILFTSCCIQPAKSRHQHNNFTDLESLLDFKAHVNDPKNILTTNWTTSTSFCNWHGVSCSRRHKQRVTAIQLFGASLQGTISPHLANLSFLSILDLSNNSFSGPIPEALSHLPRLTWLILEVNFLSGPIPSAVLNMSSLTKLYVASNNLSGFLQSNNSFIMLPNIQELSLSWNNFTGVVLSSFTQCQKIRLLSISGNQFCGIIPAVFGSLPELTKLYLGDNQLSGMIPKSFGNLTKLNELDITRNSLSGEIPAELGNLLNLQNLQLDQNNLDGSIPADLLNASLLYNLDLSRNNLTGLVPLEVGKSLPLLNIFAVENNQLTGGLEFLSSFSSCKNLTELVIGSNNFEGVLPNFMNLSKTLERFYAYENHIKGNLPDGVGNLTGLIVLSLYTNELEGPIPSTITRLKRLQGMFLELNSISGPIPDEIGQMTSMCYLILESNSITGPIPDSLANVSMLEELDLGDNELCSMIPQRLWTLPSLLYIDLSRNTLNGTLDSWVENLKVLYYLDLSMNQLSGNITGAFEKLQMLQYLNLSKNSFQGQLPASFGKLISLTYLNLSHNFLMGSIPNSLVNLSYLNSLDLSFNKLEGQIPRSGVFLNVSIAFLMGNEALCGAPWLGFPQCPKNFVSDHSKGKLQVLKYILPTIASIVLLACVYLIHIYYCRRKVEIKGQTGETSLVGQRFVSYYELVRATNNFCEANLLGRGSFGSVFKGCLDDGIIVAVKVLNLHLEAASRSFDTECEILKMLRHRNLIKIISVCSNLDFKALVLKFMPNGSLETWLHSGNCYLNLLQRLNIMLDVSLALEHLHHHHPHVVLHCDLKPTNVLLDEEMVAHVGDFGIAKLLLGDDRSIASASIAGTIGYIAPEYASTGTVSRMGDVYSFGILLLEVFTGKKPVGGMVDEESSLREWACKKILTTVLDAVDSNLLKDLHSNEGSFQNLTTIHQVLSDVIELGLLCSSYSAKERIPMTEVVVRLQKIKVNYLSNI